MRNILPIILLGASGLLNAQEPELSPTEELRVTVDQWIETMRKIQTEENEWARDQEVLQNYKEGLQKEIADLKEKIADAQTRKEGSESESLEQMEERDLYAASKEELSSMVRDLEEKMISKIALLPRPLRTEPKVAQAIENLERDIKLPDEERDKGVSKRLLNLISLASEVEKFQQTVVLRQELHKGADGKEYNMQVVYFGLSAAYAVNDDGNLALVGKPNPVDGWVFSERPELVSEIRSLIDSTTGDAEARFVYLPFFE